VQQSSREDLRRGDELLEKGDLDGQRVWTRILKAAERLLAIAIC